MTSQRFAPLRKKPATFTIREDLIAEAQSLGINASQAAEEGIQAGIRAAKAKKWLADNAEFIQSHNERIDAHGLLLTPAWLNQR